MIIMSLYDPMLNIITSYLSTGNNLHLSAYYVSVACDCTKLGWRPRRSAREFIALFFAGQANNIVSAYYWWIIGDYRSECERLQFRLRARRSPFATITATALTALTLAARRNQFGNGQVKMQWLSSISH